MVAVTDVSAQRLGETMSLLATSERLTPDVLETFRSTVAQWPQDDQRAAMVGCLAVYEHKLRRRGLRGRLRLDDVDKLVDTLRARDPTLRHVQRFLAAAMAAYTRVLSDDAPPTAGDGTDPRIRGTALEVFGSLCSYCSLVRTTRKVSLKLGVAEAA